MGGGRGSNIWKTKEASERRSRVVLPTQRKGSKGKKAKSGSPDNPKEAKSSRAHRLKPPSIMCGRHSNGRSQTIRGDIAAPEWPTSAMLPERKRERGPQIRTRALKSSAGAVFLPRRDVFLCSSQNSSLSDSHRSLYVFFFYLFPFLGRRRPKDFSETGQVNKEE